MNIRVDLNTPINDGTEVVFRSPVDCSQITGLIVYYQESGNTLSKEFAFADAHGNNVGDIDHLFAENAVVKVILDVTTGMAFVQNADTNAYLEWRFKDTIDKLAPTFTESGSAVTCEPVDGYPLHVVSSISPVQEGSGDPSPDKWEDANSLYEYRIDDTEAAYKIPNGGTYKVTVQSDVQITGIGVYLESYSQSVPGVLEGNSFRFDMPDGYTGEVWIKANSAADEYEVDFNLQKFVPGNIRPILPRSEVKVWHGGKNLCSLNNATITKPKLFVLDKPIPPGLYKLSYGGLTTASGSTSCRIGLWDDSKEVLGLQAKALANGNTIGFELISPATRIYLYTQEGYTSTEYETVWKDFMISVDGGAYEPYRGDTIIFDLGQSVYGGSLDWQTGVLTIDGAIVTLTGQESGWKATSSGMYNSSVAKELAVSQSTKIIGSCSHVPSMLSNNVYVIDPTALTHSNRTGGVELGNLVSYWGCSEVSVKAGTAMLAEQYANGTPVQFTYKMATPVTVQLTPQEILALSGANTVYSDTGDTTVSGKADPTAVIEKLTNAIIALGGNV